MHFASALEIRDRFASHFRPLRERYHRLFSIHEIETTPMLQWYFGASLFFFFLVFFEWVQMLSVTVESARANLATCWPYFQSCHKLYFFHEIYVDYSKSILYMFLYAVMALVVWCIWKRKWATAHALLLILFLWEIFVVFFLIYSATSPYYYYHIALTAVLLFVPFKEFFLKLTFVFLYFMSGTTKFDSTWILGSYFSALKTGLPIFPDALIPLFTNTVIFMQVIGCWFLLSRNWILQRTALVAFAGFHLYSGLLVYYMYVSTALLPLLIFFGPLYRHQPIPFSKKAIAGWSVIVLLAVFQLLGFVTPGDRRLTLEGNRFGMFMFEANHQCVVNITGYQQSNAKPSEMHWEAAPGTQCTEYYCVVKRDETIEDGVRMYSARYENGWALNRCDPYEWWYRMNRACEQNPAIERIALTFDHSINGGPFYRIVDTDDICSLDYKFLQHNEWIKTPPESPIMGLPVTNGYRE